MRDFKLSPRTAGLTLEDGTDRFSRNIGKELKTIRYKKSAFLSVGPGQCLTYLRNLEF